MRRREDHPLTKHTLLLYRGDFARLQDLHSTRIGAASIIRGLIRDHINKVERNVRAQQAHHEEVTE